MRVAAEPTDADFLSLQILRALDIGLTENTVSQEVFYAADKNQVGKALNNGADVADCPGNADLRIAVQSRRRGHR